MKSEVSKNFRGNFASGNSTEVSALQLFVFLSFDQVRVQQEKNIKGSGILLR